MSKKDFEITNGPGPLIAAAIHDGHHVRDELMAHMKLDDADRLREEDPYTGMWTSVAPTRVVGRNSRFQVDLNRPRDKAVYRVPEDAWGLEVWKGDLPEAAVQNSLAEYDTFYAALAELYHDAIQMHGKIVVFDLHTYNHRRDGPHGPVADELANPQVNIGTATMDRSKWSGVIDRFIEQLASFDFPGGNLDVRENVKFKGGNCARWAHETFPDQICVLSVEFKKIFMDEWTGEPNAELIEAIRLALQSTTPVVLEELEKL